MNDLYEIETDATNETDPTYYEPHFHLEAPAWNALHTAVNSDGTVRAGITAISNLHAYGLIDPDTIRAGTARVTPEGHAFIAGHGACPFND